MAHNKKDKKKGRREENRGKDWNFSLKELCLDGMQVSERVRGRLACYRVILAKKKKALSSLGDYTSFQLDVDQSIGRDEPADRGVWIRVISRINYIVAYGMTFLLFLFMVVSTTSQRARP